MADTALIRYRGLSALGFGACPRLLGSRSKTAGFLLSLEWQMRDSSVKVKFLYVLQERFSLEIPYTDRRRVVIAPDDQVAAERQARARVAETLRPPWPAKRHGVPVSGGVIEPAAGESRAAVAARQLQRGPRGSRTPFVPDGLCWYPDEQTWQMIARTRITGGSS
jgi:hypothetical protein